MSTSPIREFRYNDEGSRLDPHFHNSHELVYVVGGKALVQIGDKEYVAEKDTLLFISNLEEHHTTILESPYQRYFMELDPELLDRAVGSATLLSVFRSRPTDFVHAFRLTSHGELVTEQMRVLQEETANDQKYSDDMVTAALRQVLIIAYRYGDHAFHIPKRGIRPEVYEIRRYIEQHCAEPIQIGQLAKDFYINVYYLTHSFKELTGYSPKQYLLLNRVSRAKELLLTTDLSISEIAYRAGFFDTNNFIRFFKNETGLSPNRYRKQ